MRKSSLLQFFVFLFPLFLQGQDTLIQWVNGSFERTQKKETFPQGWTWRGESEMSQPVLQPGEDGCYLKPEHGRSYLALLVSCDSVWGGVTQVLPAALRRDTVYAFDVSLTTVEGYQRCVEPVRRYFNYPTSLVLIGYNRQRKVSEVLASTPPLEHRDWRRYQINFSPVHSDYTELGLFAYIDHQQKDDDGHVLVDHLSPIRRVPPEQARNLDLRRGDLITLVQSDSSLIYLRNPSFEYTLASSGWHPVLFDLATGAPIDLSSPQAVKKLRRTKGIPPQGEVRQELKHVEYGVQFLGLAANETGLWWAYTQSLGTGRLVQGASYTFGVQLARAEKFQGTAPRTALLFANYKKPLLLRIWAGTAEAPRQELLAESPLIAHTEWKRYLFTLQPKKSTWDTILFEAVCEGKPYNGNLLIDNCSIIQRQ